MTKIVSPYITKVNSLEGKTLRLRNANTSDAEFILDLRTDDNKSRYLNSVADDTEAQVSYLRAYENSGSQAYFVIEHNNQRIGTVRIYDAVNDSFCWGSWILTNNSPGHAAIESALMVYAFAIDTLGFNAAHFDVRKGNKRVVSFHERFGAKLVKETEDDYLFEIDSTAIKAARLRYKRYLPGPLIVNR